MIPKEVKIALTKRQLQLAENSLYSAQIDVRVAESINDEQMKKTAIEQMKKPPYPLMAPLEPEGIVIDEDTVSEEREPPRSVWRVIPADIRPRVPGWVVGALVHKALARWLFPDDARFYDWVEALSKGYGVTDKDALGYAISNVTNSLIRFQSSQLYHDMVEAEVRMTEVPYTIINDEGQIEYGIVDALYKTVDDVWYVVEYKTDYVRNADALQILLVEKDYVRQMERYLHAVGRFLTKHPYPILCFLYYSSSVVSITDRWQ